MSPGPIQIILVIVLVLLLFGANRVPMVMENVAKGIRGFKKGLKDEDEDLQVTARGEEKPVKTVASEQSNAIDDGGA